MERTKKGECCERVSLSETFQINMKGEGKRRGTGIEPPAHLEKNTLNLASGGSWGALKRKQKTLDPAFGN